MRPREAGDAVSYAEDPDNGVPNEGGRSVPSPDQAKDPAEPF